MMYADYGMLTKRLEIRRLKVEDISNEYVRGLNDPVVNRYMEVRYRFQTYERVKQFVSSHWHGPDALLFGLFLKSNGRLIGTIRLHNISSYHFSTTMGVCLFARDCWGQGYAKEGIKGVSYIAFHDLKLHYIEASVYEENRASYALFERAGFKVTAVFRDKFRFNDRFATVVLFGLVNPSFSLDLLKADEEKFSRDNSGCCRSSG